MPARCRRLLAGEILLGGKQNRVLTEDILIPPFSGPRNIAVYCVEQGRWAGGQKEFDNPLTSPTDLPGGPGLPSPPRRV